MQVDCDLRRDRSGESDTVFEAGSIEPADANGDRYDGSAKNLETRLA